MIFKACVCVCVCRGVSTVQRRGICLSWFKIYLNKIWCFLNNPLMLFWIVYFCPWLKKLLSFRYDTAFCPHLSTSVCSAPWCRKSKRMGEFFSRTSGTNLSLMKIFLLPYTHLNKLNKKKPGHASVRVCGWPYTSGSWWTQITLSQSQIQVKSWMVLQFFFRNGIQSVEGVSRILQNNVCCVCVCELSSFFMRDKFFNNIDRI